MLNLFKLDEAQVSQLYAQKMKRDFPPSELKTLDAILKMMRRDEYDVFMACSRDVAVAYALLFRPKNGSIALLDYLAVEPQCRAQGIGTVLLEKLRQYYASETEALLIECERPKAAPDETEARNRIRFYEKSGAQITDVRIYLFGVEYSLLVLPCRSMVMSRDWAWQILDLYRQMLPETLFKENVRLIRG